MERQLIENVNIRLSYNDMKILKEKANKMRVPVSTYCRTKLTQDIKQ